MGDLIVKIAGSKDDENLEVVALDIVEDFSLADHLFLDTWLQVVVDELRCNALDGLFSGWVDLSKNDLIKLA